jgi:hypothetical protein
MRASQSLFNATKTGIDAVFAVVFLIGLLVEAAWLLLRESSAG